MKEETELIHRTAAGTLVGLIQHVSPQAQLDQSRQLKLKQCRQHSDK